MKLESVVGVNSRAGSNPASRIYDKQLAEQVVDWARFNFGVSSLQETTIINLVSCYQMIYELAEELPENKVRVWEKLLESYEACFRMFINDCSKIVRPSNRVSEIIGIRSMTGVFVS